MNLSLSEKIKERAQKNAALDTTDIATRNYEKHKNEMKEYLMVPLQRYTDYMTKLEEAKREKYRESCRRPKFYPRKTCYAVSNSDKKGKNCNVDEFPDDMDTFFKEGRFKDY